MRLGNVSALPAVLSFHNVASGLTICFKDVKEMWEKTEEKLRAKSEETTKEMKKQMRAELLEEWGEEFNDFRRSVVDVVQEIDKESDEESDEESDDKYKWRATCKWTSLDSIVPFYFANTCCLLLVCVQLRQRTFLRGSDPASMLC